METRQDSSVILLPTISLRMHGLGAALTASSATPWSSARNPPNHPPIQQGAAILREGACLPSIEVDCGLDFPLHACCPSSLTCKGKDIFRCCAPRTNCGSEKACANSSWTLFDNEGYFCCDSNAAGFNVSNYRACLSRGTFVSGAVLLPTLTTDPATTPSLLELTPLSKSPSNASIVGAILGSIVGFAIIVRISWMLLRLRQQKGVEILVDTTTTEHKEEVAEEMRRSRQFGDPHGTFGDMVHEQNKEPGIQST